MKESISNIIDINTKHQRYYYKDNDLDKIDHLRSKYGDEFILNIGKLKDYSYNQEEEVSFYLDKKGNIKIENYDKIKYRYVYEVASQIFKETREFVQDLVDLSNDEYFTPIKDKDFKYGTDPMNIFYGLNPLIEERNFDISEEEFNKIVPIIKDNNKKINVSSINKKDIKEFSENVPDEFYNSDNIISLDLSKQNDRNNKITFNKKIKVMLK